MHNKVRDALRVALRESLQNAVRVPLRQVPYLVWRRSGNGWSGTEEMRLYPISFSMVPDATVANLDQVLRRHNPEHLGLVGTASTGMARITAREYIERLASTTWDEVRTFRVSDEVVERLITYFESFLDGTTIRIRYLAPIINLTVPQSLREIALPTGVVICQLSEMEFTEVYGGRVDIPRPRANPWLHMPECAFVGEFEESKLTDIDMQKEMPPSAALENVEIGLRRVVLALRTFKSGPIGYSEIKLSPLNPFCIGSITHLSSKEYIPLGSYQLAESEIPPFRAYASMVAGPLESSLETAISRLADAEIRLSSRDRIIDAVIGLEAILLHQHREEKYRQELRYRFALNYATLFDEPEERLHQFRKARDIYDLRSRLAHGGNIEEENKLRIGGERVNEEQAALIACQMLREVIGKFLPTGENPPYQQRYYWESRLFGSNRADGLNEDEEK